MPRKAFAGSKLARDAARLLANDLASPPEAKPSLMDAVRQMAPYIEVRSNLGWSDASIAALLTEAGYPITPSTLRSYRKRLRDERALAGNTQSILSETPPSPAPGPGPASSSTMTLDDGTAAHPVDAIISGATAPPPVKVTPKSSSEGPLTSRTFTVSGTNLPPVRA